ncbi:cyclic nucleotide-binding/CBS domain-containing protein [Planctomycetota bacterium]
MSIVGAFIGKKLLSCGPQTTVLEAAGKMQALDVGSILVVDDQDKILGIFTERDLTRRVVNARKDPAKTKISEVMSTPVTAVDIYSNITEVVKTLSKSKFRHLPIVDGQKAVGVLTLHSINLMNQFTKELLEREGSSTIHMLFKSSFKELGKKE